IKPKNKTTPQFQHTRMRLMIDQWDGRKKKTPKPAMTEIQTLG
ncbi:MAG: hypothetical protein QOG17_159, partial [Gammaproteobacteria bacterium]|nr:hypothetical protein [Gammaproteobacteria bacterium]